MSGRAVRRLVACGSSAALASLCVPVVAHGAATVCAWTTPAGCTFSAGGTSGLVAFVSTTGASVTVTVTDTSSGMQLAVCSGIEDVCGFATNPGDIISAVASGPSVGVAVGTPDQEGFPDGCVFTGADGCSYTATATSLGVAVTTAPAVTVYDFTAATFVTVICQPEPAGSICTFAQTPGDRMVVQPTAPGVGAAV